MAKVSPARVGNVAESPHAVLSGMLSPFLAIAFLLYALFAATGAVAPLLQGGAEASLSAEDRGALRLLLLPIMVAVPWLTLLHGRRMVEELIRTPLLFFLPLWAWCTVTWSIDPGISARRALGFSIFTLLGIWIAVRFPIEQIVRTWAYLFAFIMALSIAFAVVVPSLGLMPEGSLRGVFTHKNTMGQVLTAAISLFLLAWRYELLPRSFTLPGLAIAVVMVGLARSATAMIITPLLIATFLILGSANFTRLAFACAAGFVVAILALLGAIVSTDIEGILNLLGRDLTFTGRTDVWAYSWLMIQQSPWLGYGYQVFWSIPAYAQYAANSFGWDIPNSHSGYLETWLGLGIIGLALAVMLLVQAIARAVACFQRGHKIAAEFALLQILPYVFRNLTESDLLAQTSMTWLMIVLSVVYAVQPRTEPQSVLHYGSMPAGDWRSRARRS